MRVAHTPIMSINLVATTCDELRDACSTAVSLSMRTMDVHKLKLPQEISIVPLQACFDTYPEKLLSWHASLGESASLYICSSRVPLPAEMRRKRSIYRAKPVRGHASRVAAGGSDDDGDEEGKTSRGSKRKAVLNIDEPGFATWKETLRLNPTCERIVGCALYAIFDMRGPDTPANMSVAMDAPSRRASDGKDIFSITIRGLKRFSSDDWRALRRAPCVEGAKLRAASSVVVLELDLTTAVSGSAPPPRTEPPERLL